MICILLYILFFYIVNCLFIIIIIIYSFIKISCVFHIVCFYSILSLLFIFYRYICRIIPIQLLGCHIEINACLVLGYHRPQGLSIASLGLVPPGATTDSVTLFLIFTALHGMQTRSYDENSVRPSVCPSVCPSVKRVHCDKTEENYV